MLLQGRVLVMPEGTHPCIYTQVNSSKVPASFAWYLLHVLACLLCMPKYVQLVHSDACDDGNHFRDSCPARLGQSTISIITTSTIMMMVMNAFVTGSTAY